MNDNKIREIRLIRENPRFRHYPEYKESAVDWIGEIPSYWQTATIKHLTKNLDGKRIPLSGEVRAEQEQIYPYYGANGVIDYVDDYIFQGEHILIGEDGAPFFDKTREVSLLASGKFWVNNHCHILKNIGASEARYIVHCLNSVDYFEYITGSTRDKLTQADLNRIKIPIPTYQEQTQIANFLDRKTEQIDELIRIKERRIELLQEQRTALINQAVTKGLDPNVEMKPSGVEWIGEIPRHWNLSMLKYTARLVYGDTLISENREEGVVPVYGSNGIIDTHSSANTLSPAIVVGRKGSLGKIQYSDVPCFVIDTAYYIDRRTSHVTLRWLYYVLQALKLERFRNSVLPGLNRESAEGQYVPLITAEEQVQIANLLDRKTEQTDELIIAEQRKIERLKEYRQSLISEAVTGKIDIRNEV